MGGRTGGTGGSGMGDDSYGVRIQIPMFRIIANLKSQSNTGSGMGGRTGGMSGSGMGDDSYGVCIQVPASFSTLANFESQSNTGSGMGGRTGGMGGSGMGDDSYGSGKTSTGMGSDTYGVSKTRLQILYNGTELECSHLAEQVVRAEALTLMAQVDIVAITIESFADSFLVRNHQRWHG